jgi:hypothetical protein
MLRGHKRAAAGGILGSVDDEIVPTWQAEAGGVEA